MEERASTALHMDMMDAINISLYGGGIPAEWFIFPSDEKSIQLLREYLQELYVDDPRAQEGDVIHGQWVVFTNSMLKDLWMKKGVKPWRFHQHPGDAVYIPSRCPHMVSRFLIPISAFSLKLCCDLGPQRILDNQDSH